MRLILFFGLILLLSCSRMSHNSSNSFSGKEEELVAMLDTIWVSEQQPIRRRDSIGRVFGFESVEFNREQKICKQNHALNEKKIIALLDSEGWPGNDIIGEQGSLTICNVIQHSEFNIREKYLPMMRKAVKSKKLHPRFLARAEDRLATDKGELQIYGGQVKYYPETKSFNVWPIFDPKNVNKRRAKIGLGPIEDFLGSDRFQIEWDVNEQIKRTEEFKKASKPKN